MFDVARFELYVKKKVESYMMHLFERAEQVNPEWTDELKKENFYGDPNLSIEEKEKRIVEIAGKLTTFSTEKQLVYDTFLVDKELLDKFMLNNGEEN